MMAAMSLSSTPLRRAISFIELMSPDSSMASQRRGQAEAVSMWRPIDRNPGYDRPAQSPLFGDTAFDADRNGDGGQSTSSPYPYATSFASQGYGTRAVDADGSLVNVTFSFLPLRTGFFAMRAECLALRAEHLARRTPCLPKGPHSNGVLPLLPF